MSPLPVILASASPRRQELLREVLDTFEVCVSGVDEDALQDPDPWRTAEALATAKASAVAIQRPECLVIGGDTVVAIQHGETFRQFGKPVGEADAARMLRELSGRTHFVITGFALIGPGIHSVGSETTRVTFIALDEPRIQAYVATGEPMDKAGAYAIQGGAADFVKSVDGSWSNVVGLPVEALRGRLRAIL